MKKSHDILRTTEDIFYREIAREWLEYSEFRLKESSYAKYRSILNKYLLPAFGNDCISQLTTDRVAELLKNLRAQETETIRKRLSPQYINGILTVFRETSYYSTSRGFPFPCNFRYLSQKTEKKECSVFTHEESRRLASYLLEDVDLYKAGILLCFFTGIRLGDADGKISLNQQKPSKHAGLRRFGPEKFLQRNNEFMKERPIFYKKPIKTEKDFSTWLRCFYYTTKAVITEYIYF